MTKDEALKLALEALTNAYWPTDSDLLPAHNIKECAEAITAIKAALANEALERKAENARELGLDYEPLEAKDEPVGDVTCWTVKGNLKNHEFDYYGNLPDGTHLLYATPPQRKPLTDEQVDAIWPLHTFIQAPDRQWLAFARAIEAAHQIYEDKK